MIFIYHMKWNIDFKTNQVLDIYEWSCSVLDTLFTAYHNFFFSKDAQIRAWAR